MAPGLAAGSPGIAVATRLGAAIVLWEPWSSGSGPLLLLGCAQLLHAPDLVQQARDEGLDKREEGVPLVRLRPKMII